MSLFLLILAIPAMIFVYYRWSYQYWKRKNLPYLTPRMPYGHITGLFRPTENLGVTVHKIYSEMKRRNWKHGGIFALTSPVYVVVNLDYVKNIMANDFQYFSDRGLYYNEDKDPLSAHLFAIGGPKWRYLRTKFNPTFSPAKTKMMFQNLVECEMNLQRKMLTEYEKNQPMDIKKILDCFTLAVIGSCALGLDCKTMEKEDSPFIICSKKFLNPTALEAMKIIIASTFPNLARGLGVTVISRNVHDFFMTLVKDTVHYREKNNCTRKDFMQLLIDMRNGKFSEEDGYKNDGKTLTIEEVAAQCFVFFLAGFETSSTTMAFALYELAKHQDIQDKVREEIKSVLAKYDGKITYESIQDMKYMNQIIDETLRKYPPALLVMRQCVKDYKIPDEDVIIEKGTTVFLPILGIHYDEEYYDNPEKFDPERFTKENKNSRHQYSHIPFGQGPRQCIAMRFGLVETKVGLTSLLKNYTFTVNEKTQEPLEMQVHSLLMAAKGEIWLDAEKI